MSTWSSIALSLGGLALLALGLVLRVVRARGADPLDPIRPTWNWRKWTPCSASRSTILKV